MNLPASVRVMSQSDFKSSQAVASAKISSEPSRMARMVVGNGAPCARSMNNTGFGPSLKSGTGRSNPLNSNASDQHQNHSEVVTDKRVGERGDSGLQMHPLLFQAPQNGHLPYYPLNSSTSTSSSFTFFSGNQSKLSLSLFHNPRHIRDAVNFLSKSSKPQENASSSGVGFHPLLQRTDDTDMNSAAGLASITESKQKRALVPNPSVSISKPLLDGNSSASGTKVASLSGKVNELDLDIHLSFTSKNQKGAESRNMTPCSTGRSLSSPVLETIEPESAKSSSKNGDSALHGFGDEFDSGDTQLVTLRTKGSRKVSDAVRDESLPEIIMEEEELSDSEEEFGENVEFECEEMADSEGDSMSDSEHIVDLPNEVSFLYSVHLLLVQFERDILSASLDTRAASYILENWPSFSKLSYFLFPCLLVLKLDPVIQRYMVHLFRAATWPSFFLKISSD